MAWSAWSLNRPPTLLWFAVLLLLLLPTAAGRLLLDLVGGLALVLLAVPLLLTGLGWIGWKVLQSRMVSCPACGTASIKGVDRCPACGTSMPVDSSGAAPPEPAVPASDVTIDVTAQEVNSDS